MIGAVSPEEPLTLEAQREDVLQKGYEVVLRFANRPQLFRRKRRRRGFIAYPQAGTIKQPGAPFKMSETPWEIRTPAPTLGQHNETILGERLGLSGDEIKSLNGARVG